MAMAAGMKRKDVLLDQVSDDFSDFSLSSPATKIRRLDAELPPIPEMEEDMEPVEVEESPLPIIVEQVPNEERAIVVYNPISHPPHPPFSLALHSHLLSGFKNWSSKQHDSDCDRLIRSQQKEQEDDKYNQRMALVPWAPSSSSPSLSHVEVSNTTTNTEEEPDDEMGGDMDIEIEQQQQDQGVTNPSTPTTHPLNLQHAAAGTTPMEFHQWQQQQQHCFLPQFPQNTSTPITWTR